MGRNRGLVVLLVVLALVLACTAALAAERGKHVMLILDASGSMWGQIGGKAKIVIAKEVMSDLIQDLPSDLQVGLMVYGHRQKDDCNDVEELFPVADLDRNQLITSIRSIKPKGKTPIAHSVSLAAEKMKPFGPGSTIILVSDGEETCGGDPCKLVAELKAGGIDFVMHVVGFGVKGAASEQLACIAKAGGGTYTEAADAGKLKAALSQAIEKTLAENLVIRAVQVSQAKGAKPAPLEAVVKVLKDGVQMAETSGTKAGFKLEPGVYDLSVTIPSLQQTQQIQGIKVTASEKTEKEVPFTVSAIGVRALDSLKKPIDAYLKVFAQGQDGVLAEGWTGVEQPRLFALPPGTYRLEITEQATNQKVVLDEVVLPEGQEVIEEVSFALAKLGIRGKDSQGQPINVHVKVFRTEEPGKEVAADWSNAGGEQFFELPPGVYDVTVEEPGSKQSVDLKAISLEPGASVVKEVSFAKAKLGIRGQDAQGKPINVHVKVFTQGKTSNQVAADWSNAGGEQFFELPPGVYDVTVEEPGSKQSVDLKAISLEPGASVVKEVSFAMARLGIRGQDSQGKPINVHVKVFRTEEPGKEVAGDWSNAGREQFFKLPPGTYDVVVEETRSKQSAQLKAVSLEPGADVVEKVTFAIAKLGVRGKNAQGQPINVHVKVFRQEEPGKVVASDWSNAGREHFFELPPGMYDVTVEENKSQQKTDLKAISLEPGATVVKEVSF